MKDFLKSLAIGVCMLAVGNCTTTKKNFTLEEITTNLQSLNFKEEMQNFEKQKVDNLQKLMNNVIQIRMKAKEKREFLTKKSLSDQIEKNIRENINRIYDGTKTEKIVSNLLSENLMDINMQIAFANVRGDLEFVGTGFVYKTCKGDVLLTSYHVLSPDRYSYQTSYGNVIVETKLRNRKIFYNEQEVNLENLVILSEPNLDLIITRLPDNFKKKTYPVKLARKNELRAGEKIVKVGNTFGEGIQISQGIIGYNGTKEKIILGRKMEVYLLSLPVAGGDSGSPVFLEQGLKFVGMIVGMDPVKDNFSVPTRAYVLPWKQSIGKLKQISPYNECSFN